MTTHDARRPALAQLHHPYAGVALLAALTVAAAWAALRGGADWQIATSWVMLAAAAGFATSGST